MRGGIGGYPEIRRENEAGIKEVAARPDLNVMKRREHLRNADWAGMLPLRLSAPGRGAFLGAVGM